ncbi:MAG: hypothetical protein IPL07_12120 [Acidimicrobiaceae bacterium]|nr:hypothetical protein [Acidimicrobiaceae bacterium]
MPDSKARFSSSTLSPAQPFSGTGLPLRAPALSGRHRRRHHHLSAAPPPASHPAGDDRHHQRLVRGMIADRTGKPRRRVER